MKGGEESYLPIADGDQNSRLSEQYLAHPLIRTCALQTYSSACSLFKNYYPPPLNNHRDNFEQSHVAPSSNFRNVIYPSALKGLNWLTNLNCIETFLTLLGPSSLWPWLCIQGLLFLQLMLSVHLSFNYVFWHIGYLVSVKAHITHMNTNLHMYVLLAKICLWGKICKLTQEEYQLMREKDIS